MKEGTAFTLGSGATAPGGGLVVAMWPGTAGPGKTGFRAEHPSTQSCSFSVAVALPGL